MQHWIFWPPFSWVASLGIWIRKRQVDRIFNGVGAMFTLTKAQKGCGEEAEARRNEPPPRVRPERE